MVACRQQNEMGHFLGSGEPAGDVLLIPAGTIHPVKNVGSGNGAELATYVVEKGSRSSRCRNSPLPIRLGSTDRGFKGAVPFDLNLGGAPQCRCRANIWVAL
jgi:hypothetical protein